MNKRDSDNISLPSCLVGQAPERHFKRQMVEKFGVETNIEDDEHKIQMRLKQISYGKNTIGYDRYIAEVPKNKRKGYSEHPRTPDPYAKASKREFDGKVDVNCVNSIRMHMACYFLCNYCFIETVLTLAQVKAWRRALHRWDVNDQSTPTTAPESEGSGGKQNCRVDGNDSCKQEDIESAGKEGSVVTMIASSVVQPVMTFDDDDDDDDDVL